MRIARHPPTPSFAHLSQSRHLQPPVSLRPRYFSASCSHSSYYQTLGIPKSATKNQIKASYYKLSKQYHPDVNKDPAAKERFQAVSEAYAILGDERQRRAYDRSIVASPSTSPHTHPHHEPSHTHWTYDSRRRGATHAWEYARRPNTSRSYTYPPPPGSSHYTYHYHQHSTTGGPNPFSNPNVQRATGRKGPLPTDRGPTQSDHVARESFFIRTAQVTALVIVIGMLGHGMSASAA